MAATGLHGNQKCEQSTHMQYTLALRGRDSVLDLGGGGGGMSG